jgi:hypothetical protein
MTQDQILEEIRQALYRQSERPSRDEGWLSMEELQNVAIRKDGTLPSETWVRRRIAQQAGEWDRVTVNNFAYFRRKNGQS